MKTSLRLNTGSNPRPQARQPTHHQLNWITSHRLRRNYWHIAQPHNSTQSRVSTETLLHLAPMRPSSGYNKLFWYRIPSRPSQMISRAFAPELTHFLATIGRTAPLSKICKHIIQSFSRNYIIDWNLTLLRNNRSLNLWQESQTMVFCLTPSTDH